VVGSKPLADEGELWYLHGMDTEEDVERKASLLFRV
jgi:hypothetical protein